MPIKMRSKTRISGVVDHLSLGRGAYLRQAWREAYRRLALADGTAPLGVDDLDRLAMSAYLTGRDEEYLRVLDRTHRACVDAGNCSRAARAAFWLGLRLAFRGEVGPATGWFRRAERLLQREAKACAEEGYLLLPEAERQLRADDAETAYATAVRAAEIGDRFAEADLGACARHLQGRAMIQQARVEKGLSLLDEAMVAVVGGELSPIMTGLIYCSVVEACQQVHAVDRARQWTAALAQWCSGQPQLVTFTGTCLVHRAEIMQMNGAWRDAIEEAHRACTTFSRGSQRPAAAAAYYQEAEIHRLRGEFGEAEEAYRRASRQGFEPLPGLALLRFAQGRKEAAVTLMSRALSTATDRLQRTRLLPTYIEIMLDAEDVEAACDACHELNEIADLFRTAMLRALAAQASGAVHLAKGSPQAAIVALRRALDLWVQVEVPYHAARTRKLIGLACRALGDQESADLELAAAREAFEGLGAAPEITRIDFLTAVPSRADSRGLTRRELQVLRLMATGKPNRLIAAELCLSEKTIDRHISNIFNKLDVPSRTAAAIWAYKHKLT